MELINLDQTEDLIKEFCEESWIDLLNERSRVREYRAKSHIFKEGEEVSHISIIRQGKVKIFSSYTGDSERIYRFATNGQIIGHRGFSRELVFPVSAFALVDTKVLDIPISLFDSLLKTNPLFCYHILRYFAKELRESEQQIKDMTKMDLRHRMANALRINIEAFGFDAEDKKKLNFTISRKDFSHLVGTTYESVIRTLSDFQKENIIQLINKEIRITNQKKLLDILSK